MSAEEKTEQRQTGDKQNGGKPDVTMERVTETPEPAEERATEKPEITDEHKATAKEMAKSYSEDLQTTTLPGSSGTVSGTAVTDWVDDEDKGKIETSADEGNVEYRETEEFKKKLEG
ncbi:hypothetical protein [Mycolicibacterium pyrenivorans]|uniref:hypothetical protein n=1 Tax=Mycolicibacterium pyrenivorans TaxID=187102 RepID=UPI0021F395F5|nr:hypothetical protein [Mycolicibacterium pyrenivorans]MCV7151474.1 hypothetical protein [Mycolicibacterium pyrenivorans]